MIKSIILESIRNKKKLIRNYNATFKKMPIGPEYYKYKLKLSKVKSKLRKLELEYSEYKIIMERIKTH